MQKLSYILLLLVGLIAQPAITHAQCKGFVKKHLDKMTPFTHNGQMNVRQVKAGETTELFVTFYSGQAYRLLLASEESLGKVYYNLVDEEQNVVYSNKETGKVFKDFNIANTMKLKVEIITAKPESGEAPIGCVSVLVGFKSVAPTRGGF